LRNSFTESRYRFYVCWVLCMKTAKRKWAKGRKPSNKGKSSKVK